MRRSFIPPSFAVGRICQRPERRELRPEHAIPRIHGNAPAEIQELSLPGRADPAASLRKRLTDQIYLCRMGLFLTIESVAVK